jgi:CrcB protein
MRRMTVRLALLALAGGAGTLARYGMHLGVVARLGHPAIGTFVVNTAGCMLLGLFWSMLHQRDLLVGDLRLVLLTGFLGAFTTFSALLFDTAKLARDVSPGVAVANVAGQLVAGALAMALGAWLGRFA